MELCYNIRVSYNCVLSSLLDMANSNLNKEAVHTLIESICKEHGLEEQTQINFENFCQILSPQMDKLWNAGLDWKGLVFWFFTFNWSHVNRKRWNICISNGKLSRVGCNINFYFIQEDESVCPTITKRKKGKSATLHFYVCKNLVLIPIFFFCLVCLRINILIRALNAVFFQISSIVLIPVNSLGQKMDVGERLLHMK